MSVFNAKRSVESPSRMDIDKAADMAIDVEEGSKGLNDGEGNGIGFKKHKFCQKNDGKGWKCRKEVEEGYSFCKHHLTLIRSYGSNNNNSNGSKSSSSKKPLASRATALAGTCDARAKAKKSSASNPHEYYYYTGFGPWWGRKRDNIAMEEITKNIAGNNISTTSSTPNNSPPSPKVDNENHFDYVDYHEEGKDESIRRKRMRKPMKARSLTSLFAATKPQENKNGA